MQFFRESLLELIIQTPTNLPPDVCAAMAWALKAEQPKTQAGQALAIVGQNIDMAFEDEGPICQDTAGATACFACCTSMIMSPFVLDRNVP